MKIAICDDIQAHAERVKSLLLSNENYKDSEIALFTDSRTLLATVDGGEKYDIAFLDVDMPALTAWSLANSFATERRSCL